MSSRVRERKGKVGDIGQGGSALKHFYFFIDGREGGRKGERVIVAKQPAYSA